MNVLHSIKHVLLQLWYRKENFYQVKLPSKGTLNYDV